MRADGRKLLFDTGQGYALAHNARIMGCDLKQVSDLILSHGHYDHAGGLAAQPEIFRGATLYVHPAALRRRFAVPSGAQARFNGIAFSSREDLEQRVARVIFTTGRTEIAPGGMGDGRGAASHGIRGYRWPVLPG